MDTRAYRLKCLEGCAVFEVDLPKIVDFKSALLKCAVAMASDEHRAPDELEKEPSPDPQQEIPDKDLAPQLYASSVERVAADLATDEWWGKLISAGFKVGGANDRGSPAPPTIWVLEGLLYYLKEEEAMALLRRISSNCAPGTLVFADFMNEFSTHLSNELQTQFYFHSDWPEELLPTLGYARVRVSQMGDPDANFGLIHDSPLSLFHRLRQIPRYCKLAPDGSPCRRLFLVQFSVA
ncbi:hypothetical protein KP509_21G029900 [Ceratopteris richardii]|nr:hypothetical protein KP509_21G029900 [Ceratopteris richardii]